MVFGGNVEESTYVIRRLADAIFQGSEPLTSVDFMRLAYEESRAILTVGNAVAARASVGRGVEPISRPGDRVLIPPLATIEALKQAATWDSSALATLLEEHDLSSTSLDSFIMLLGSGSLESIDLENGPLDTRPIVRMGDGKIIVGAPGLLLPALRHRVIHLAKGFGVLDQLATRFTDAVWRNVNQSLRFLGHYRVGLRLPQPTTLRCYRDGFFSLDIDKLLYVQLVSDDLEGYADTVFDSWKAEGLADSLENRARAAEEYAFSLPRAPNELMMLFLMASPGRSFMLGLGPPVPPVEAPRLAMTAADLETIALLRGGNPLTLLKYAEASEKVRCRTHVFAFSQLDEYHLFRSRGYSYYVSDDGRPDMITLDPGMGSVLRRETYRQRDWHGAPSHRRGYSQEVTHLHEPGVPLYISPSEIGRRAAVLIEGLPFPIWVVGPEGTDGGESNRYSMYAELADCIAYWLWQFTPAITPALQRIGDQDVLALRLSVPKPDEWYKEPSMENGKVGGSEELVSFTVDAQEAAINLRLHSGLRRLLNGADNEGERVLMARVLESIRDFVQTTGFDAADILSERRISAMLDQFAPLGMKKKLLFLNTAQNPELDPEGLPPFRKVQKGDENELLDELGDYLTKRLGLKEGPLPDQGRIEVLNAAVKFLYDQLEDSVATLNGNELLRWLIEYAESITRHIAFRRLTIPTRLACFGTEEGLIEQLNQELPEGNKAANASRFLIEYVAARPPAGIRPMSLTVYDRLMGLASGIFNFGSDSDLIHFGIADTKLSMLRSGRLGAHREAFLSARESFLGAFSGAEMRHAKSTFAQYWPRVEGEPADREPPEIARAQEAFQAELGITLGEIASLLSRIMDIGQEQDGVVKTMSLSELVAHLSADLGWDRGKVSAALSQLTLSPRAAFLEPEPPVKPSDVYPWRFNRALSYMRRPIVLRTKGVEAEVFWGNRHVRASGVYFIDLYTSGRLKAVSDKMKRAISLARTEDAETFNDTVADLMEEDGRLRVRRRVRRIGKVRIGGPDDDLGDIDVLVANAALHRMLLIECKDLAVARTPRELANELETLFHGARGRESVVDRQQRRSAWVEEHIGQVLAFLDLPRGGRWQVRPIIVVDEEMFSPHLFRSPIPVISFHEFKERFVSGWNRT